MYAQNSIYAYPGYWHKEGWGLSLTAPIRLGRDVSYLKYIF